MYSGAIDACTWDARQLSPGTWYNCERTIYERKDDRYEAR